NEIWVAEGVYYPDEGSGQMNNALTSTFTLRAGVALYGGFAGDEEQLAQRDWPARVTVLSGDIDGNDLNDDGNRIAETWNDLVGANAYHVVTGGGVTETARLDGFTVTAGYANGSAPNNSGGGMRNDASSPTLTHVTFSGNRANSGGGGMYNDTSNPTLTHATFRGNRADSGGGMRNRYSNPTLTHVTFSGNQSDDFGGGGMDNNNSSPTLTNVAFSGNRAGYVGGGMYNLISNPTLTNVTFSGNWAYSYGGGMYNINSNPGLTNVTFSGNQAGESGGGIYNSNSGPALVNCILWGDNATNGPEIYSAGSGTPAITYSAIQGWSGGGTGNLNADPQFVAPITATAAPTTTGDYRLRFNSPAVDAGNSLSVTVATDLAGNPRIMNGAVDMGAYEAHPNPVYVDADATGSDTGLSWTDAYTNVQDALVVAVPGNEIWVAEGVYYPDEGSGQTNNALTSTFTLTNGVALYGGFAATETLLTQRDWPAHVTVLSGDIDGDDLNDDGNRIAETTDDLRGSNAYHVVTGGGVTETARLDGFTVTAGSARGVADDDRYGGGMRNDASRPMLTNVTFSGNRANYGGGGMVNDNSGPTLTNVTFSGNWASEGGGGMFNVNSNPALTHVTFSGNLTGEGGGGMINYTSSPTLTHVTFSGNWANYYGGGMVNDNSSPALTHVTFSGNWVTYGGGGGMLNDNSSPALMHVTFSGNRAGSGGGGMVNDNSSPTLTHVTFSGNQVNDRGGGMLNDTSSPTLTNVAFSGNFALFGGGMYNSDSNPTLTNITFSGNRAGDGGGMYNSNSNPTLVNCILWGDSAINGPEIHNAGSGSSPVLTYSAIQGWSGGGMGNLARDPQFVAPVAASSAPTTTGNYRLREDSPAIDAGAPATCPPDDLDGQPRADLRCDMGAYERQYRDGDTVIKRDFTGGTPYSFGPTWVSVTLSLADTGALTVTKHLAYPGGTYDEGEVQATWWISSSLNDGLPATFSLCYTDAEVAGLDESRLEMFRWNGSAWVDQNATPDPANNCVTLSGVTGFSAWTLKDVSVGAETPTAARVVALTARGFAPVAALLALGGAATFFRRRRR
ncbi:MAG TPA: choice-of-anchor Q domain-containing protein, partial [Anaerolineae bacterium]|nr:choice-of-anchor Q domain-containing protein [Anaerolineae bacterium]